jgi:hypothetical protein
MLYTLLGRAIWFVIRGYVRFRFPHARRNLAATGIAAAVLAAGWAGVSARRPREGG